MILCHKRYPVTEWSITLHQPATYEYLDRKLSQQIYNSDDNYDGDCYSFLLSLMIDFVCFVTYAKRECFILCAQAKL